MIQCVYKVYWWANLRLNKVAVADGWGDEKNIKYFVETQMWTDEQVMSLNMLKLFSELVKLT